MSSPEPTTVIDHRDLYLRCVDHIGKLERRLESLQRIDRRGPSHEKLGVLMGLLADLEEFLRSDSDAQRFESSAADLLEISEELRALRKLVGGRHWGWLGLGGSNDATKFEIRQRYDRLQERYMPFVIGHLVECINALRVDNNNKRSFLESIDAFSSELSRIW